MNINEYINAQPAARQASLLTLHGLILHHDHAVVAEVSCMMGKRMIRYDQNGKFKYGLSGETECLTLHCMPIYCHAQLRNKYGARLTGVKLQKGCINFANDGHLPLAVIAELIRECAGVDMTAIMAAQKKSR